MFLGQPHDTVDIPPGDGDAIDANGNTSLRAAIQEANALDVWTDIGFPWSGKPGGVDLVPVGPLTAAEVAWFERGAVVYGTICATCHQPHGGGEPVAPSLNLG